MKKSPSLTIILFLCLYLIACKKSDGTAPVANYSSVSFSANDTLVSFPINLVYIQDVTSLQTTVITGQYADTSSKTGNISIRVIGDTTGRYAGDSLLVGYTDSRGTMYYNHSNDSTGFAQIDKFPKNAGGIVSGSFSCTVFNGSDSVRFTGGVFKAPYQD